MHYQVNQEWFVSPDFLIHRSRDSNHCTHRNQPTRCRQLLLVNHFYLQALLLRKSHNVLSHLLKPHLSLFSFPCHRKTCFQGLQSFLLKPDCRALSQMPDSFSFWFLPFDSLCWSRIPLVTSLVCEWVAQLRWNKYHHLLMLLQIYHLHHVTVSVSFLSSVNSPTRIYENYQCHPTNW
jgi:hypothetical protein